MRKNLINLAMLALAVSPFIALAAPAIAASFHHEPAPEWTLLRGGYIAPDGNEADALAGEYRGIAYTSYVPDGICVQTEAQAERVGLGGC